MRRVRARDNETPEESDEISYMVYALDAAHRQDQVGAGGAQGQALRRPASQEHLRVRDAVHRRRAALRVVRPERRALLLHARRQAALEEAVAAAADLPRLRHGLVSDRARRPRLPAARQRGRLVHHRARREDGRGDLAHGAAPHRPAAVVVDDAVRVEEREAHRDRDARARDGALLRPRRHGAVARDRHVDADGIAARVERLALRRQRLAGRREPSVPGDQARRVGRHHPRRRRRPATTSSPGVSRACRATRPSAIVHDGRAYLVHDTGILAVLNAKTGKQIYKVRVGGGGHTFSASPVAAGRSHLPLDGRRA